MFQERTLGKSVLSLSQQCIVYTPQFQFCAHVHGYQDTASQLYFLEKQKPCILMYTVVHSCPSKETSNYWEHSKEAGIQFSSEHVWVGEQGQELRKSPCRLSVLPSPVVSPHAFMIILTSLNYLVESSQAVVKLCYLPSNQCTKRAQESYQDSEKHH